MYAVIKNKPENEPKRVLIITDTLQEAQVYRVGFMVVDSSEIATVSDKALRYIKG